MSNRNQQKYQSYVGQKLQGTDFSSSVIEFCDFRGADLHACNFSGAFITSCNFSNCNLSQAVARKSTWNSVYFTGSDLSAAHFEEASFRNCMADSAQCLNTNFELAYLNYTTWIAANFEGAIFSNALTLGSSFSETKLDNTVNFFLCREMVVEVLKRSIRGIPNGARIAGMAMFSRWCYAEWKKFLERRPELMQVAEDIFKRYPHSYILEALQAGWKFQRRMN